MTASISLPDVGIITVDKGAFSIRQIASSAAQPLLVDGDTGYGEALNGIRMVRTSEAMGYEMVIWPVSSRRVANKAKAERYDVIEPDDYEALDVSIANTIVPEAMPQG